jgi:hypothetical protein
MNHNSAKGDMPLVSLLFNFLIMDKKKMPFKWFFTGFVIFAIACSHNNNQSKEVEKDSLSIVKKVTTNAIVDARGDSIIDLTFPGGDSSVVVLGKLESTDQHITVRVPVRDKRKLSATLLPLDSLTNIRFNQIVDPNGKSAGPFGRTISIATQQNGTYQLFIAHNLMAEGGLAKEFRLQVTLSR